MAGKGVCRFPTDSAGGAQDKCGANSFGHFLVLRKLRVSNLSLIDLRSTSGDSKTVEPGAHLYALSAHGLDRHFVGPTPLVLADHFFLFVHNGFKITPTRPPLISREGG
jgi:hypothetical protein